MSIGMAYNNAVYFNWNNEIFGVNIRVALNNLNKSYLFSRNEVYFG